MLFMAGILDQLIRPQKRSVVRHSSSLKVDPVALELETAKEILAEVFKVRLLEVDEMIQNRFEAVGSEENEQLWPQEFLLNE
jgi:hypothetical protein